MKDYKKLTKQIYVVLLLYLITFVYALLFAPQLVDTNSDLLKNVNTVHESCLVCDTDDKTILNNFKRGRSYYIGSDTSTSNCLITFWGASHYMLYTLIGYFAPDLFVETFVIGCLFEVFECYQYDCHDSFDIVLNSLGFLTGYVINTY